MPYTGPHQPSKTIVNCFAKCGFSPSTITSASESVSDTVTEEVEADTIVNCLCGFSPSTITSASESVSDTVTESVDDEFEPDDDCLFAELKMSR